jgi:hypothetical protein
MKALFDADIIVFRAGFAAERQQWYLNVPRTMDTPEVFAYKREAQERLDELLPGKYSRVEGEDYQMWPERYLEPLENALHNVNVLVEKCLEAVDCTEFDAEFYLSGKGDNFRHEMAKTRPYKGNRDDKHRPSHEDAIRKYIRGKWPTIVTDGIEADDALGIAQCSTYGPEDSVIISIDKDLDQLPGLKYNFVQEINYDIDEGTAWRNFCTQLLTGDSTDNIPGLPRVGKAKASKRLAGLGDDELLDEVARAYCAGARREDWFSYLKEQAGLIWIMREEGVTGDMMIPDSLNELDTIQEGEQYELLL